jgi:Ca-activated chloride channel homolog
MMNASKPNHGPSPSPAPKTIALTIQAFSWLSCASWFLLWPGLASGSPSSALREYKAGQYDQALKEYERLLQKKSDDPRLHFNAGAAAYRNRQFDEAAKQFNATLASPDLKLQGLAYYNEGNSLYHLGEGNPDPKKRTESWEKAIQDYQSSMKLNPQDADAKFNYEFVKKRLEELKQQQQQNQQNKQDQNQNQDQQQQQQQQQGQNQQKQDQQKQQDQQQQQQAQQNQKQDSSQQQQAEQQKKQEEQQQAAKQSEQQKQDQQQAQQQSGPPKDKSDEKEQEAAAAQALAQMTPEQAQQLLDAQKADEQMLPPKTLGKPVDRSRPIKDW